MRSALPALLAIPFLATSCTKRTHPALDDAAPAAAPGASAAPSPLPPQFDTHFAGAFGGTHVATMHLVRSGLTLSGTYSYRRFGAPIALSGTVDAAGAVSLTETTQGKPTGEFKGRLTATSFEGTWSSPDGRRTLPFVFTTVDAAAPPASAPGAGPTPSTNHCSRIATSAVSRYGSTGTILPDGHVLLVGSAIHDAQGPYSNVVEELDPSTHALKHLAPLHVGRAKHAAVLMNDGRVLVVGGMSDEPKTAFSRSAEVFDPAQNRWSTIDPIPEGAIRQALITLPDGRALLAGGDVMYKEKKLTLVAALDPKTMRWSKWPDAPTPRAGALFPLADGRLLFTGDTFDWYMNEAPDLDVLDPATGAWTVAPSPIHGAIVDGVDRVSANQLVLFAHRNVDGGPSRGVIALTDAALSNPRELPLPSTEAFRGVVADGAIYATVNQDVLRWDEPKRAWTKVATFEADDCSSLIVLAGRGQKRPRLLFAGRCGVRDPSAEGALELCEL